MKPITLENLRRLMGGGRKKKDRGESSFKRSESFKRISIRKNYLERGGRGRNPWKAVPPPVVEVESEPPPPVIGYGQWIECLYADDYGKVASTATVVSSSTPPPPVPPPRRRHDASSSSNSLEILRLEKSPEVSRRRFRKDERSDSALSVSLGRIWMDAPLAMANAPRSLELPRASSSAVEADPGGGAARRAHHSLDSALKEKREEPKIRGLRETRAPPAVCRTLSSTTQTDSTGKTLSSRGSIEPLSSSKDSGFSFSVSPPPTANKSAGFFRKKKKTVKPKLSVSREGYFKRTSVSVATSSESARGTRTSVAETSSVKGGTARSDLYQVVVGRPPRSLKLDPLIFVPPEKRSVRRSASRRYEVHEIRDYCTPRDLRLTVPDDDEDEGLYECISGPVSDYEDEEVLGGDEEELLEEVVEEEEEEEEEYQRVRRPVRRRKSRKTVKYVAKIHRAPSTLKRNNRKKC
ncbi:hypothetical protein LSTR_LSTR013718, partial [Laodelphax striatellus]